MPDLTERLVQHEQNDEDLNQREGAATGNAGKAPQTKRSEVTPAPEMSAEQARQKALNFLVEDIIGRGWQSDWAAEMVEKSAGKQDLEELVNSMGFELKDVEKEGDPDILRIEYSLKKDALQRAKKLGIKGGITLGVAAAVGVFTGGLGWGIGGSILGRAGVEGYRLLSGKERGLRQKLLGSYIVKITKAQELAKELQEKAGGEKNQEYYNQMEKFVDFVYSNEKQALEEGAQTIEQSKQALAKYGRKMAWIEEGVSLVTGLVAAGIQVQVTDLFKGLNKENILAEKLNQASQSGKAIDLDKDGISHIVQKINGAWRWIIEKGDFDRAVGMARERGVPDAEKWWKYFHQLGGAIAEPEKFHASALNNAEVLAKLKEVLTPEVARQAADSLKNLAGNFGRLLGAFVSGGIANLAINLKEKKELIPDETQEFNQQMEKRKIEADIRRAKEASQAAAGPEEESEVSQPPRVGSVYDLSPLGLKEGEPLIIKVAGVDADGNIGIDYFNKLEDSTPAKHLSWPAEDFQGLIKIGDKQAELIHQPGQPLPKEKALLEKPLNKSKIEAIQQALTENKIATIIFNQEVDNADLQQLSPDLNKDLSYSIDSLKLNRERPAMVLDFMQAGQHQSLEVPLTAFLAFVDKVDIHGRKAVKEPEEEQATKEKSLEETIKETMLARRASGEISNFPPDYKLQVGQAYSLEDPRDGEERPFVIIDSPADSEEVFLQALQVNAQGELIRQKGKVAKDNSVSGLTLNKKELAEKFISFEGKEQIEKSQG